MLAYSNPEYLNSLSEFGEPYWLPSGLGVLTMDVPGSSLKDARAAYPLFSPSLAAEIGDLRHCVSFVGVADPLQRCDLESLSRSFPDCFRPYKEHHIVDLGKGYSGPQTEHHRRNLGKAHQRLSFSELERPHTYLEEWCAFYRLLIQQRSIRGIAAFSRRSFGIQLRLSELRAFGAFLGQEIVGMSLWMADGEKAYYHLGAQSEKGAAHRASYGLFDLALASLEGCGVRRALLGAGAGVRGDREDGLSRFKAGWSTSTSTAYLCGKILDPEAYGELCGGHESSYFPGYRCPEKARATVSSPELTAISRRIEPFIPPPTKTPSCDRTSRIS